MHNVPFDPNLSPEFTQKGRIESTCRDIIAAATPPPRPTVHQREQPAGKKAAPLHSPTRKITVTLMKTTKKVGEDFAAGQPREALAKKPTKCCVQLVLSYDSSTGFN